VEQWGASSIGAFFTRSAEWAISLKGPTVVLLTDGRTFVAGLIDPEPLVVRPGHIWSEVIFTPTDGVPIAVDGIPNSRAQEMLVQVGRERNKQLAIVEFRHKCKRFDTLIEPIVQWWRGMTNEIETYKSAHWWLPQELVDRWQTDRSKVLQDNAELTRLLGDAEVMKYVQTKGHEVKSALEWRVKDIPSYIAALNEEHLKCELIDCTHFLDNVEKSPLTKEQARSVICFDNRVMTVAAAGSGKTSTMVAKAGYALYRRITTADKILMLAFNGKAAKELQHRADERLKKIGIEPGTIKAQTFHAFGFGVIGRATGKKPSLASWVEKKKELEKLAELIDGLKDRDEHLDPVGPF